MLKNIKEKRLRYRVANVLSVCVFYFMLLFSLIILFHNNRANAQTEIITTVVGPPDVNLGFPTDLFIDNSGKFLVSVPSANQVGTVDPVTGDVVLVAGTGMQGFSGDFGLATDAELNFSSSACADSSGNIFIADTGNNRIRKVDFATGIITTVAGSNGRGFSGDGGLAIAALLKDPQGISVDGAGNIYIADTGNNRIRKVDSVTGIITTVVGEGGNFLNRPIDVFVDNTDKIFVADTFRNRILMADPVSGFVFTVAGTGGFGFSGDFGLATEATLKRPTGVFVDDSGNVFISDQSNHRIRKVDANTGIITTVAGNGVPGFAGDGSFAVSAQLNFPTRVFVDDSGDIFIVDKDNSRIRKVSLEPAPITTTTIVVPTTTTTIPVSVTTTIPIFTTTSTVAAITTTSTTFATTTTIVPAQSPTPTVEPTPSPGEDVVPTAEFDADPTTGFWPLAVKFTDKSAGNPTSWSWDFGDGNFSSEQNPTNTYQQDGDFTVRLTVSNSKGSDTEEKINLIDVLPIPDCAAAFNADKSVGFVPLEVNFTDRSTGNPTSWSWDFGDGGFSSEQNPTHVYETSGIFTVRLIINSGDCGTDTIEQNNFINALKPVPVNAEFSANPTSGFAPLDVQFNNLSTGEPASFSWLFGDGGISSEENPTYTYQTPGIFSVTLVAAGESADIEAKTNLVNVLGGTSPTAAFVASPLTGFAPMKVQFTDTSSGNIANWSWDFGDGSTSSLQNPIHEYKNPGFFNVKLIVSGNDGTGTEDKTNLINILDGQGPTAAFFAEPLTGNAPLTVNFFDISSGDVSNWTWEFGDGEVSIEQNPAHTYNASGTFNVKLTVSGKDGASSKNKTDLVTVSEGTNPTAAFTADKNKKDDLDSDQLTVKFKDLSSSPSGEILAREWDFGDGTKSILKDPEHTYTGLDEDVFNVSLSVRNSSGIDTVTKRSFISLEDSATEPSPTPEPTPTSSPPPPGKQFTFSCKDGIVKGRIGLEKLVLQLGEREQCVLRLTNFKPGLPVEVASRLRKGLRSAIKIEPERSITDEKGELEVIITAIRKGVDWAAWALKNNQNNFEFSRNAYDTGFAWGFFVEVE